MQLLPVFNDSYEETSHIKTARLYLENLLQITKLKLGGHTFHHWQKVFLQRWINYFKDLIDEGLFDLSDQVDQECQRFSFYGILQDELDEIMKAWNQHRIRRTRTSEGSNGVPDVMYFPPNRNGKENRRDEIVDADLLLSREFISEPPYYESSNEFAELPCIIINELQIDMPKDKESAEQLYFRMKDEITSLR